MGKGSSSPPAPDYTSAAQATAQGNLEATRAATKANRVNQYTPYGSLVYSKSNQKSFDDNAYKKALEQYQSSLNEYNQGNLTNRPGLPDINNYYVEDPDSGWALTQSFSPEQQALFDQNNRVNKGLGDISEQGLGYVQSALNKPLSFEGMQDLQAPGQIQQQASDAAYQNAMRYVEPRLQRQQSSLENQLANQGITRGSEAWNASMQDAQAAKQGIYDQAQNNAYLQGLQGAAQAYSQSLGRRQQQIGEAQTLRQDPINMLNAVRTGSQMQVAQMPQNVGNSFNQATTSGADYMGAAQGQYGAALGKYNANAASDAQDTQAFASIAAAMMMA
jgi:hypothetical protein